MRSPRSFTELRWIGILAVLAVTLLGMPRRSSAQEAPPPRIQELLEKSRTGAPLTAAEQNELVNWSVAQAKAQSKKQLDALRAQNAPPRARNDARRFDMPGTSEDDDARRKQIGLVELTLDARGCPSHAVTATLGAVTAPRLMALLDSIGRDMLVLEGVESGTGLQRVASRSDAKTLSGMGGALWLSGADYAAAYFYAESAKRGPSAQTLTNLGAALNGIGDARRAALVLRAADAITPNFPPILTNLGVAYARLGDLASAEATFRKAVRSWPAFAEAQTGLARVLVCGGKTVEASLIARASVGASPTVRRAHIADDISRDAGDGHSNKESNEGPSDGRAYPDRPPSAQKVINVGGKSSTDVTLTFIPLASSLTDYVDQLEGITKAAKRIAEDAGTAADIANARETAALAAMHPEPVRGPARIALRTSDADAWAGLQRRGWKAETEASRADSAFTADARHAIEKFEQVAATTDDSDMRRIREVNCAKNLASAGEAYANAHGAYVAFHAGAQKAMQDYARDAKAWIDEMHDPAVVEAAGAAVAARVASWDANVATGSTFLAHAAVWRSFCAKPDPAPVDAKAGRKPEPPEPKDCEPFFDRAIGILNVVLTCRTFEISGGEGLIGKVKYDVVSKSGTVFVGAGFATPKTFSATEGSLAEKLNQRLESSAPPPWIEGHAGVTIGFDGNGLTDGGFSFGVKGGIAGKDLDLTTQMTIVNGMTHSDGFSSVFGPTSTPKAHVFRETLIQGGRAMRTMIGVVGFLGIAAPALAQSAQQGIPQPTASGGVVSAAVRAAFVGSLTASSGGSSGKQVVASGSGTFEQSAPNASRSASVTLQWGGFPNAAGYAILRARPTGGWDVLQDNVLSPATVTVQVTPSTNVLLRVGAKTKSYSSQIQPGGVAPTNASLTPVLAITDTTSAVRVITP